jgi:hypothetical protein
MKEPTEEQMRDALSKTLLLEPHRLNTILGLLPTLEPWQKELLTALINERAEGLRGVETYKSLFENSLGMAYEVKTPAPTTLVLPLGYVLNFYEAREGYMLHHGKNLSRVALGDVTSWATGKDAILAAYEHDRLMDPLRWRPVSETCPDQTMLLFACADWEHSVQLGKPVPTHSGYRNSALYRIFGADWAPTHWCYQPAPPPVVKAESHEIH